MAKVTLGKMFLERADLLGSKVAVQFKEGRGAYQSMSWHDFGQLAREVAFGLAAFGLQPRSAVGIFSPTSHLWIAADLGTMFNGAFSVPLYPNSSIADVEHILNNSEASFVFS
jgi:long-chain acyl-CoA synthetase